MSDNKNEPDEKLIVKLLLEAIEENEEVAQVTVSQLVPLLKAGYRAGLKEGKKQHIEQMKQAFEKAAGIFRPVY